MKTPLNILLCVLSLAACSAPPDLDPEPTATDTSACWCPPDHTDNVVLNLEKRVLLQLDHQLIHAPVAIDMEAIEAEACLCPPAPEEAYLGPAEDSPLFACGHGCGCLSRDDPDAHTDPNTLT